MTSIARASSELTAIYTDNMPFFASHVQFVSEKGDYRCLFCDVNVTKTDNVAITYARSVRFAHCDCLESIDGALVSTDKKLRQKAINDAKARRATQKAAGRATTLTTAPATTTPAVDSDALRATIRAEIEAEYDEAIDSALQAMTALNQQIAELQEALRLAKADYTVMYEKATELQRAAATTTGSQGREARRTERRAALVTK